MTFKERAIIGKKELAKQPPVTLEEAREQVRWLKNQSTTRVKKKALRGN